MAVMYEQELKSWIGRDLDDSSGDKIGKVEGLYYDGSTGTPEWLLVKTGLGDTKKFVPFSAVKAAGDHIVLSVTRDHLEETLQIGDEDIVTDQQQRFLCKFWGLEFKPMGKKWQP
jgi:sporulation protein YlmC with PRC-barrel domain